MSAVDSIEGPTVRLYSGDLVRVDNIEEAYELRPQVEVIVDIGEILINYGDFLENNHPLMPSSYVFEWWHYDYEAACPETIPEEELKDPSAALALRLAEEYNVPLHPKFTYLWHDINRSEFEALREFVAEKGSFSIESGILGLPLKACLERGIKFVLEKLLVLHRVKTETILIEEALPFILCLGLGCHLKEKARMPDTENMVDAAALLSGFKVYPRAPFKNRGEDGKTRKIQPAKDVSCSSGSLSD